MTLHCVNLESLPKSKFRATVKDVWEVNQRLQQNVQQNAVQIAEWAASTQHTMHVCVRLFDENVREQGCRIIADLSLSTSVADLVAESLKQFNKSDEVGFCGSQLVCLCRREPGRLAQILCIP